MITFEVWDGVKWVDKTDRLLRLSRRISSRSIEAIEFTALELFAVGARTRVKHGSAVAFEGVVYEVRRQHRAGDVARCEATAYSDLIVFDRYVVFREYAAGTKAGTVIKDLASLEGNVDVSNVDEANTPELKSPWTVQNM
ncbi:MAG: hypothetical protein NZ570_08070, partial [Candidatus Caldarchaeum sp.]|nr:hypothetical protein [Candidatus Caldarchaeum sp.]